MGDGAAVNVKLSIVVPVYNAEKYVGECLRSLCSQTLREVEIICVDDGSTDGSFAVINRFKNEDCRIKVIRTENKGRSAARERGCREASGAYITLVDDDDWVEHDSYRVLIRRMEQEDADAVIFNWYLNDGRKERKCDAVRKDRMITDRTEICRLGMAGLCPQVHPAVFRYEGWPWNKIYKKSVFDRAMEEGNLFREIRHFEDAYMNMRLLKETSKLLLSKEFGYHYRKGNPLAGTEKYYDTLPDRSDFMFYKEFGRKYGLESLDYSAAVNAMEVNLFWDYITKHHYFHKDNPDSLREQKKEINHLLAGRCAGECFFPIKKAMEKVNPDWINSRTMCFLVTHHKVSFLSLYIGSRISLAGQLAGCIKRREWK